MQRILSTLFVTHFLYNSLYISYIANIAFFHSMNILPCALWGDLGQQFMNHYNSKTDDGPMVVIIKHAQIREPKGF
jgi:hypothetical protein